MTRPRASLECYSPRSLAPFSSPSATGPEGAWTRGSPRVGGGRGAGLRVQVSRRRRSRGENREEEQTARIGPGAMASKEEQAVKNLDAENAQQKNVGYQVPMHNGEEPRHLAGGKAQKPGGNVRLGWVRRLMPNFRWVNKHVDHNEVGDNIEKIAMQRMEIRRKTREQQMRHDRRFQTPEPDNHYDFCLIP